MGPNVVLGLGLSAMGCGLPMFLLGLLFLWLGLDSIAAGGEETTPFIVALVMLGLTGLWVAHARKTYKTSRLVKRVTLERGQPVVQESFQSGQATQYTRTDLTPDSQLEGKKRIVKRRGRMGGTIDMTCYDVSLERPLLEVSTSFLEFQALNLLLVLQRASRLPIRTSGFSANFRPRPKEGCESNLEGVYQVSPDQKSLQILLKPSLSRLPLHLVVIGLLFGGMSLPFLWSWKQNGGFENLFNGLSLAIIGIILMGLALASFFQSDEVTLDHTGITWKGTGQKALSLPLSEFREMAILEGGLYCFLGSEVRDLLEGAHSREERCYLYRLINSTLEANGEAPFEGSFGSRNLRAGLHY